MDGFSVCAAHSSHEWRPVPLVGRTYWTRLMRSIVYAEELDVSSTIFGGHHG